MIRTSYAIGTVMAALSLSACERPEEIGAAQVVDQVAAEKVDTPVVRAEQPWVAAPTKAQPEATAAPRQHPVRRIRARLAAVDSDINRIGAYLPTFIGASRADLERSYGEVQARREKLQKDIARLSATDDADSDALASQLDGLELELQRALVKATAPGNNL